ncbi:nucleotide sugar dehydrogenase [Bacillus sp. M6-12]|uniref:nucleotide sugar dehydrogenase n=1 Tax=Bacillus sp. M6-12 TaxID=2054166 RepID=UPI00215538ED|nr:nucleotide sugar dehydrogenase [Bacillus sp. M6-12]
MIGLGFVGLTTALGFSDKGYKVYGYDIDVTKREQLRNGKTPFYEPYLGEKLNEHLNRSFVLVKDLNEAIDNSEIIFLCVGTPSKPDGSADLSYIFQSIKDVTAHIKPDTFKTLVLKSTIPPSTASKQIKPYLEELGFQSGVNIGLANNPEFLREGTAWEDFMNPERILIGHDDSLSGQAVTNIYLPFKSLIYRVNLTTAEFIKYLSNTLLATLISFANEQSMIARSIGEIDISKAFRVLHRDKRWFGHPANMTSYVYPGCGFGGYCLPKDINALVKQSEMNSFTPELLKSVINVNESIKQFVVSEIDEKIGKNEKIGILGLAFKPNSNDIRDTQAKTIIEALLHKGYKNIIAYDPLAMDEFKAAYGLPIEYASNLKELLKKADNVVLLTAWEEFIRHEKAIKKKRVFDYRYVFNGRGMGAASSGINLNDAEYEGKVVKPIIYSGKNRYLVMARVGDSSQHKQWIKKEKYKNFDIFLEYFGDGSNNYQNDCDFYSVGKSTKWPRFYKIMEQFGEEILKYDAVWMPDDDIITDSKTIHKLFAFFMKHKLSLAQPALTSDSFYSHKITLKQSKYKLRYTKFVEVMVPMFSPDALRLCWNSFKESKSGWGLDSLWPHLLGYPSNKMGIIDAITVKHMRPVGQGTLYTDIQGSQYDELYRIIEDYGVTVPFDFKLYGSIEK